MINTSKPREDTLPARVVAYFKRLPDEELSNADIAIKWHADPKNVGVQLAKAVEADLLCKNGTVYYAGPNIGQIDLSPSAITNGSAPAQRKPRVTPDLDIEAIQFDEHVPITTVAVRLTDRWSAKLRTMRKGQSFLVDEAHRHGVNSAATALRKGGMQITIRREGEARFRVFCLKGLEVVS